MASPFSSPKPAGFTGRGNPMGSPLRGKGPTDPVAARRTSTFLSPPKTVAEIRRPLSSVALAGGDAPADLVGFGSPAPTPLQAGSEKLTQAAKASNPGRPSGVIFAARVRPENEAEKKNGAAVCLIGDRQARCVIVEPFSAVEAPSSFVADHVFPSEASQMEVYEAVGKEMLKTVMTGFAGTLFAYGQSGSGKTYSMQGHLHEDELKAIQNGTLDLQSLLSGSSGVELPVVSSSGSSSAPLAPLEERLGLMPRLLCDLWKYCMVEGGTAFVPPDIVRAITDDLATASSGAGGDGPQRAEGEPGDAPIPGSDGGTDDDSNSGGRYEFRFHVSFLEIYMEQVADLLVPSASGESLAEALRAINSRARVEVEVKDGETLVLYDGEAQYGRADADRLAAASAVTSVLTEGIAEDVEGEAEGEKRQEQDNAALTADEDEVASVGSSDLTSLLDLQSDGGAAAGSHRSRRGGASMGSSLSSASSAVPRFSVLPPAGGSARNKGSARPSIGSLKSTGSFGNVFGAPGRLSMGVTAGRKSTSGGIQLASGAFIGSLPPPRIRPVASGSGGFKSDGSQQRFEAVGCIKVYPRDLSDIFAVMAYGERQRATAATALNKDSSRSHSIFQVFVTRKDNDTGMTYPSKLNLVDLAGSERIHKTQATGERFEEGKSINQSLSSLGRVIDVLTQPNSKGPAKHIPFRDSQLTMLLADALGGKSRTALMICLSPSSIHKEESLSTLRFGAKAKLMRNTPTVDVQGAPVVQKLLAEMQLQEAKIRALQAELSDVRGASTLLLAPSSADEVDRERARRDREESLIAEISVLKGQCEELRDRLALAVTHAKEEADASRRRGASHATLSLVKLLKRLQASLVNAFAAVPSLSSPPLPASTGLALPSTFSSQPGESPSTPHVRQEGTNAAIAPPSPVSLQSPPGSARSASSAESAHPGEGGAHISLPPTSSQHRPDTPGSMSARMSSLMSPKTPLTQGVRLFLTQSFAGATKGAGDGVLKSPSSVFRSVLRGLVAEDDAPQGTDRGSLHPEPLQEPLSASSVLSTGSAQAATANDSSSFQWEEIKEEQRAMAEAIESLLAHVYSGTWRQAFEAASAQLLPPLHEENKILQGKIKGLKQELVDLQCKQAVDEARFASRHQHDASTIRDLTNAVEDARAANKSAASLAEGAIAELTAALKAASDEAASLREQISRFPLQLAEAVAMAEARSQDARDAALERAAEDYRQQLGAERAQHQQELVDIKAAARLELDESQALLAKTRAAQVDARSQWEAERQRQEEEFLASRRLWEEQAAAQDSKLKELSASSDSVKKALQAQLDEARSAMLEKDRTIADSEAQLRALSQKFDSLEAQLDAEVKASAAEKQAGGARISQLQEELSSLRTSLQRQEEALRAADRDAITRLGALQRQYDDAKSAWAVSDKDLRELLLSEKTARLQQDSALAQAREQVVVLQEQIRVSDAECDRLSSLLAGSELETQKLQAAQVQTNNLLEKARKNEEAARELADSEKTSADALSRLLQKAEDELAELKTVLLPRMQALVKASEEKASAYQVQLERAKASASESADAAAARVKSLDVRVSSLTTSLAASTARCESLERDLAAASSDLAKTRASSSDLSSERQALVSKLDEQAALVASLQARVETLSGDHAQAQHSLEALTRMHDETQRAYMVAKAEAAEREIAISGLQTRLSTLDEELREAKALGDFARQQLSASQEEAQRLKEDSRKAADSHRAVTEQFSERQRGLEQALSQSANEVATLTARLAEATERMAAMQKRVDEFPALKAAAVSSAVTAAEHTAEQAAVKALAESTRALAQAKIASEQELAALESKHALDVTSLLEEHAREVADVRLQLRDTASAADAASAEARARYEALVAVNAASHNSLTAEVEGLRRDVSARDAQLQTLQVDLLAERDKLAKAESLISELRDAVHTGAGEIAALKTGRTDDNERWQAELRCVRASVDAQEAAADALSSQLATSQRELRAANEALEQSKASLLRMQGDSQTASLAMESKYEKILASLRNESAAVQQKLSKTQDDLLSLTQSSSQAVQAAEAKAVGLEKRLMDAEAERDALKQAKEKLAQRLGTSEEEYHQLSLVDLPKALARAVEAEQEASRLSAELEEVVTSAAALRVDLDAREASLSASGLEIEALHVELAQLRAEVSSLSSQASELEVENELAARALEESRLNHEEQVAALRADLESKAKQSMQTVSELRARAEALRASASESELAAQQTTASLKAELADARAREGVATRSLEQAEQINNALEEQVELLELEKENLAAQLQAQALMKGIAVQPARASSAATTASEAPSGLFSAIASFAGGLSSRRSSVSSNSSGKPASSAAEAPVEAAAGEGSESPKSSTSVAPASSFGPVPAGVSRQALWESLSSLVKQVEAYAAQLHERSREKAKVLDDIQQTAARAVSLEMKLVEANDKLHACRLQLQVAEHDVAALRSALEKKQAEFVLLRQQQKSHSQVSGPFTPVSANAERGQDVSGQLSGVEGEAETHASFTSVLSLFNFVGSTEKKRPRAGTRSGPERGSNPDNSIRSLDMQPVSEASAPAGYAAARTPLSPRRGTEPLVPAGASKLPASATPLPAAKAAPVSSSPSEN